MINASPEMVLAIETDVQKPLFKLLSYDVSSATGETWGTVIAGNTTQTPTDLTQYVSQIQWSYEKISIQLADEALRFHPDTGDLSVTICNGRGIRLLEGAQGVPEDQWIPIYSGIIQGVYGWSLVRGPVPHASFTVFPRSSSQAWNRRSITSKEYTVGSDWSLMFRNIAQDVMGLEDIEIAGPNPWGLVFDKTTNQVVNIPAWEALQLIAQGNFNRIWFNGKGQLATYPFTLDRVDRVLTDNTDIGTYAQTSGDNEVINKVSVTYIDNVLSKVKGARQSLGQGNLTAGFYDFETKLDVFYSDDKKQRAENVELVVRQSINQNDLGISIGSERLDIKDEFGGELVITVDFWVSALATAGIAGILVAAAIPDLAPQAPTGTLPTISVGRVIEAASIIAVLLALMILGNGIYEIFGEPFDYAFLEKKAICLCDNLQFYEEKELEIRNEFISTVTHAEQLALNELLYQKSLGQPRTLVLQNDPRIEKGDIIQLPTGAKFFVQSASKTFSRGGRSEMVLRGFRSVV